MSGISYPNFGFDANTEIVTRNGILKLKDISLLQSVKIRGEDGCWHSAEIHNVGMLPAYEVQLGKHCFVCSSDQSWPIMNSTNKLKFVSRTTDLVKGDRIRFTLDYVPEYRPDNTAFAAGLEYATFKVPIDISLCSLPYLYSWLQAVFSIKGQVDILGYHALVFSTDTNMLTLIRDVCAVVGINTSEVKPYSNNSNYYRLSLNKSSLFPSFFKNPYHLARWDKVRARPTICQSVKCVTKLDEPREMFVVIPTTCAMFTLGTGELVGSPLLIIGDRHGASRKDS